MKKRCSILFFAFVSLFFSVQHGVEAGRWFKPGGVAAFTPTSITKLTFWVDGSDASKMTLSGSNITAILDKSTRGVSGTGNGSGGTFPTKTTNGLNSKTTIHLTASSNQYFNFGTTAIADPTNGIEIIWIVKQVSLGSPTLFFLHSISGLSNIFDFPTSSGWTLAGGDGTGGLTHSKGATTLSANTFYHVDVHGPAGASNTGYTWIFNGSSITSSAPGGTSGPTGNSLLGCFNGGAFCTDGELADFYAFNAELSSTERSNMNTYLSAKWGI